MSDITRYHYNNRLLKIAIIFSAIAIFLSMGMMVFAIYLMFGG